MAMASAAAKLSYQRLKHDIWFDEEDNVVRRRLGEQSRLRRFPIRRKLRVKIPRLRRFLGRKVRQVRGAWKKVCRRLKESQSHFGDLFAGNYLFMQVNPTPLKYAADNSFCYKSFAKGHSNHQYSPALCPSRLSDVPRVV
ncbi:uncharacterized protein LOC127243793 [Andrographis paniculata]|uniref:uncharacterized protein LOC127243793 n=1 Tax=Andrographis paniculata TaxID=175694 RepID=UPI0021E89064|nr:uncharacterized protein LOC127243793 [Andrographis paniculata]